MIQMKEKSTGLDSHSLVKEETKIKKIALEKRNVIQKKKSFSRPLTKLISCQFFVPRKIKLKQIKNLI